MKKKANFENELKSIVKTLNKMRMDDDVQHYSAIFAYLNTAYIAATAAIAHIDELDINKEPIK